MVKWILTLIELRCLILLIHLHVVVVCTKGIHSSKSIVHILLLLLLAVSTLHVVVKASVELIGIILHSTHAVIHTSHIHPSHPCVHLSSNTSHSSIKGTHILIHILHCIKSTHWLLLAHSHLNPVHILVIHVLNSWLHLRHEWIWLKRLFLFWFCRLLLSLFYIYCILISCEWICRKWIVISNSIILLIICHSRRCTKLAAHFTTCVKEI